MLLLNNVILNKFYVFVHGKNDFAEISKNLNRYRSENNFETSK